MSVSSVVGIDVAEADVDVFVLGAAFKPQRFDNEADGHSALAAPLGVRQVVMAATGGYEAALACSLQAAGLAVAVVNPRQARDFAKGMGFLAKTGAMDARALAAFADAPSRKPDMASHIRPLTDEAQRSLAALVARRRQLLAMMLPERQRLPLAVPKVRPSIQAMIEAIEAQLDDVEAEMVAHVQQHFGKLDALLRATKGIGPVASATLIAELPELGSLNRRETAALVGLAPMANDSGNAKGRRRVQGGSFEVRRTLLHDHPDRCSPQPGHRDLLRSAAGRRNAAQGRSHRLHARAPDHAQRHGQERAALGFRVQNDLTRDTIA